MSGYVYLAGKMTGLPDKEIHEWRNDAKKCFNYLEVNTIDPSILFDDESLYGHESEREVMRYELRAVRKSAVVLVNMKNINTSVGTIMELATAFESNVPIIGFYDGHFNPDKVHPWIMEVVERVFDKVADDEEVILNVAAYIKSIYF